MNKSTLRLIGGFALLVPGGLLLLILPEIGVPLALLGTRLLGDRYKWARTLNQKIDVWWAKSKTGLKRIFRR